MGVDKYINLINHFVYLAAEFIHIENCPTPEAYVSVILNTPRPMTTTGLYFLPMGSTALPWDDFSLTNIHMGQEQGTRFVAMAT